MKVVREFAKRLNIAPLLRGLVTERFFKMAFPTFSPDLHSSMMKEGDYFRHATMALAVQRIVLDQVEGHFAEVGVYRGDSGRLMHSIDPSRNLYLFDTFEGFPKQDLEKGVEHDRRFKDTSVKIVLRNIGHTKNVIIKKGRIPDTLTGLESVLFAFVLVDLDLYVPTVASLEFFYPKISRGGYLMVHDYNNPESNWACKRAVDEFMRDKRELLLEIADNFGTVVIRKT